MKDKLNFTIDGILKYKPATEINGYNCEEVDAMLDKIIDDYDFYIQEIEKMKQNISDLETKNKKLKEENESYIKQFKNLTSSNEEGMDKFKTNSNTIIRLNNIESTLIELLNKLEKINK